VGGDRFFASVVDAEAGVFPREEIGELFGTDEFGSAEALEKVVAEKFDA
jgi:hypothetical protein